MTKIGSREWNNRMFLAHPTPYRGIAGFIEKQRLATIIKKIKRYHTAPNPTILELGCESGHLLEAIQKSIPQAMLTGVDISDLALKRAREHLTGTPTKFLQADISQEISIDSKFDLIICSETLEHIPDFQLALAHIHQLCTSGSLVILTVPLERFKNQVKNLLGKLGLMRLLFKGIETGFSAWHVQDFSESDFKTGVSARFEILEYQQIWKLHQLIVAKKKST